MTLAKRTRWEARQSPIIAKTASLDGIAGDKRRASRPLTHRQSATSSGWGDGSPARASTSQTSSSYPASASSTTPRRFTARTASPNSSRISRTMASPPDSPGSTCPPGKHQLPPARRCAARRIMSTASPRRKTPITPGRRDLAGLGLKPGLLRRWPHHCVTGRTSLRDVLDADRTVANAPRSIPFQANPTKRPAADGNPTRRRHVDLKILDTSCGDYG